MYVAIHTLDVLTTLTSILTPTCTYCQLFKSKCFML